METRIHIVCGPTASGKSARALEIAQEHRGVIINADAMQVYSDLRIVTARPSAADESKTPHALYGILPASEICSVARWLSMATAEIETASQKGLLPIVTGGTGLYIKALMDGLSDVPDVPAATRAEAEKLYAEQGAEALAERDPAMAARLKPGDTQRHTRALAVWLATGKSLAYWQEHTRVPPFPSAEFSIELVTLERKKLYEHCDARFLNMLQQGALDEVRALSAQHLPDSLPCMRAVGVPELMDYLNGKFTLVEATADAQQATRNYAKRQMTWFRNQLPS